MVTQLKSNIDNFFNELGSSLERINVRKDQIMMSFLRDYWPNEITPNHLTIARFIIGITLFVLLFNFKITSGLLVLPLFFIGILTDLLDGVIARGFNKITKAGTIMDPIADKVIIIPIAIYSLLGQNQLLLIILIFCEIINAMVSLYAEGDQATSGSNIFGKTKMVLQSVVFMAILVFWPMTPSIFFIYILWISVVTFIISLYVKLVQIRSNYAKKAQNLQHTIAKEGVVKTH